MAQRQQNLRLIRLQHTQNMLEGLAAESRVQDEALPKAAGAENQTFPVSPAPSKTNYFALHNLRRDTHQGNLALMRERLEDMIDVLNVHDKTEGVTSMLKYQMNKFLDKLNLKIPVSIAEFESLTQRFLNEKAYQAALKDEINNERLKDQLRRHQEGLDEDEEEKGEADADSGGKPGEEDNLPAGGETSGEEEATAGQQNRRNPLPRVVARRPTLSPEMEAKLNQANESMQKAKKRLASENPPQLSQSAADKLSQAQTRMRGPEEGRPRPSERMSQRLNSATRMRPAAPLERPTPRVRAARPVPAPPREQEDEERRKRRPSIRLSSPSGGIPWVPQFIRNAFRSLLRNAFNLGRGVVQGAWNLGSRALGQLLPRISLQAGLAAGKGILTSGGVFLTGAGGALSVGFLTVILGALALFILQQKDFEDCGKSGTMNVVKSAKKMAVDREGIIQFEITINYKLNCAKAQVDNVEVRDPLPTGTTYEEDTTSGSSVEITDPFQPQTPNEIGGNPLTNPIIANPPNNTSNAGLPGLKPTLEGNILVWKIGTIFPNRPITLSFGVKAPNSDTWVMNQATVTYSLRGLTSGKVIDSSSLSFQQTVDQAAQTYGMEPALLKAFLRVEAPQVLQYSEEEFNKFSTAGWWEGLLDNAPTRNGNHPDILRGYGYNTCAYTTCAAGADVRGVAQFEIRTWNGVVPQLQQLFADGHTPDRRIAKDAIFGSALHNLENARRYTGSQNPTWTEDVIKAAGRIYCGGFGAANRPGIKDPACVQGGVSYDDLLWAYYKEYSGK